MVFVTDFFIYIYLIEFLLQENYLEVFTIEELEHIAGELEVQGKHDDSIVKEYIA